MTSGETDGSVSVPEIRVPETWEWLPSGPDAPPEPTSPEPRSASVAVPAAELAPPARRPRHAHAKPKRRPRLPLAVVVICWAVLAALGVVAIMRFVAWDAYQPFIVLNDLTAFVYLPAWMVAIVAALGRRPVLGAAALLVVVAQVVFMLPELTAAEPVPTWAAGAQTVQLLDANVYSGNPSMVGYAAQIQQFRPDLVTMQEASPTDVLQLQAANALVNLPYQFEVKRWDPTAFFIASHYLIRGVHVVYLYGRPLIVQLTVELPSGPLPLWVVHTVAPLPSSYRQWKGQMTVIDQLLRTRGPADLLLVGDFNATWGSNGFRRILNAGMSDGAATRGEPFAMTWSQTMPVVPPLVRIDHVLTGPGVAVTKIANGAGEGSDHRDLIATVAVDHRPPA